MKNVLLFFVIDNLSFFEPTVDAVQSWKYPCEIAVLRDLEAVLYFLDCVHEEELCVIVTELSIPSQRRFEIKTGAVMEFVSVVKQLKNRNRQFVSIVYTSHSELIEAGEKKNFDFFFNARDEGSYQALLKRLKELLVNFYDKSGVTV